MTPQPWMESAVCAGCDPELWFPEKGGHSNRAQKICRTCPVRAECLAYAWKINATHGIWGGLRVDERKAAREGP